MSSLAGKLKINVMRISKTWEGPAFSFCKPKKLNHITENTQLFIYVNLYVLRQKNEEFSG